MQKIYIIILLLLSGCVTQQQAIVKEDKLNYHFTDPKLNKLVQEALKSNNDILTSMINISKAQATLNVSEANRLPEINLVGSASKSRDSKNMLSTFSQKPYNVFSLSTMLSYQLDIWGKMAAANKSAKAQLLAMQSTKQAVELTIVSEVAKAYFNIIALDNKIKIAERSVHLNEELDKLKAKQFNAGLVDDSERQKFNTLVNFSKSQLLELQQQLIAQETIMAVMLGREVSSSVIERDINVLNIINIPENLNSKLLMRRPDIKAAEQQLIAAKYQIDVARAEYFPEISLNALLGFNSNYANTLLTRQSRTKNMGANLSMPILNFGKTGANVRYAEADKEQSLVNYEHIIRVAFAEAITSLAGAKNADHHWLQSKNNEQAMAKVYNIVQKQFKAGMIDYLSLLEGEKNYLSAKINYINAVQQQVNSEIEVFKAFAGNVNE